MIGETVSHYHILEKLGEGGMGVVYRARDLKLDRLAALKFLPRHLGMDPEAKARFLHEAKAASALEHPNIGAIYEIDETEDGHLFLAMSYYGGDTLARRIREGPLTTIDALDLSMQIARGLTAAHARGIVHRDLKPANILLAEDGQVKIVDFGLAKLAGRTQLTKTGTTVGTVAYMSPEQAAGGEVDARSDLFSLGIVLYELLTGRLPFRGDHEAAMLYAIQHEPPEPIRKHLPNLLPDLEAIANRALQKDPADRYAKGEDLLADLEAVRKQAVRSAAGRTDSALSGSVPRAGGARPAPPKDRRAFYITSFFAVLTAIVVLVSLRVFPPEEEKKVSGRTMIAVIPFTNLGPVEDEYFADGITEEIMARLAGIGGLGVIARTSILQYRDTEKTIAEIGEELGVEYVLEGTVRWQHAITGGSRVRVTPQLVRVQDETHVWADIYDQPLTEVFEVQADIARKVADELDLALTGNQEVGVGTAPTGNMEAYDLFLQSKKFFKGSVNRKDWTLCLSLLEKATELDPTFAEAFADVSMLNTAFYWYFERSVERIENSKTALDRAMALDPDSPAVRASLGWHLYRVDLDYDGAYREFARAKELRPGDSGHTAAMGFVRRRQGRWQEAIDLLEEAWRLDPKFFLYPYEIGETMNDLKRYDDAIRYLEQATVLDPEFPHVFIELARSYLLRDGSTVRPRQILERTPDRNDPWILWVRGHVLVLDREFERALDLFEPISDAVMSAQLFLTAWDYQRGRCLAALGREDEARLAFTKARRVMEQYMEENPEDPRAMSHMGLILARLGEADGAVRHAELATEIMPVTKESKQGAWRLRELAIVYGVVGRHEDALDLIERLLVTPASGISVPYLRIDPVWDPLRDHPRFRQLLATEPTET